MKIRTKLLLLLAIPLLAIAVLGGRSLLMNHQTVKEMDGVVDMTELAVRFSAFVHESQKERGCTAVYLGSGGKEFSKELQEQRAVTNTQRAALEEFLRTFSLDARSEIFQQQYEVAVNELSRLDSIRGSVTSQQISASDAISYYTNMHGLWLDTLGLMSQEVDDRELALLNNSFISFLKSKERAGIERAVLSATFSNDSFAPGHFAKAIRLASEQDVFIQEWRLYATDESKAFLDQALAHPSVDEVNRMREIAFSNTAQSGFGIDAGEWFSTITMKINQLKLVDDKLAEELKIIASAKRKNAAQARLVLAIATLSLFGIIVAGGLLIIRSISRPVSRLEDRITVIVDTLDLTVSIDVEGNDEIGQLAGRLRSFVAKIRDVIAEVTSVTADVAAASTEIAASAEQIAGGMNEQSQQVTQVSAAVEEMAASILEVAQRSSDAAGKANESGTIAENGGKVVENTISGMSTINQTVSTSAQAVQELGQRNDRIGEVVTAINDIADQTNLLALNAAIEAARAGEHGRGFAVVADEVRKLADRTTQATAEIASSIEEIQGRTREAVANMNTGTEQVAEGVSNAEQAGIALTQILSAAQDVSSMIQSIAAATEEQSAASEQVSQSIEQIAAVTQQTREGTSQAAVAAAQLSERASGLQELVSQFRVGRS